MSQTSPSPEARIQELEALNVQLLEIIRTKDQTIAKLSQIIEQLTTAQAALYAEAERLVIAKDQLLHDLNTQDQRAQELHNKYKLLARQVMEM